MRKGRKRLTSQQTSPTKRKRTSREVLRSTCGGCISDSCSRSWVSRRPRPMRKGTEETPPTNPQIKLTKKTTGNNSKLQIQIDSALQECTRPHVFKTVQEVRRRCFKKVA